MAETRHAPAEPVEQRMPLLTVARLMLARRVLGPAAAPAADLADAA